MGIKLSIMMINETISTNEGSKISIYLRNVSKHLKRLL